MTALNLALLGAGRWGQRYIEAIRSIDTLRLVALASQNPESAARVPAGCRIFADWRDAVTAPGIDAVVVATPPHLHAEMALASIDAHRPVLIEKPLTLSLDEAAAVEKSAIRRGVLAVVGHTHLYNPAFRELKRRREDVGAVRAIRSVAGNWGPFRADVSPLWDWSPHDLSMCLDLIGGCPKVIGAERTAESRAEAGLASNYRLQLEFAGPIDVGIEVGNLMDAKKRRFDVIGDDGSLIFDDVLSRLTLHRKGSEIEIPVCGERPLTQQIIEFVEAIRAGNTQGSSLRIGCNIVQIIAECERLTTT
ncbi:MAG: Gfo/Idh/MocA family oxidoreductase [Alphaproteobacteria bacterium]|nr:Gfo/Idh/MocA family oxidoreductase [Alphaproteobacteria bacterium]MBL7099803.1 Gfo/Idh/MocA family oxidoreductase [Alphaproteobacteria bacterium]